MVEVCLDHAGICARHAPRPGRPGALTPRLTQLPLLLQYFPFTTPTEMGLEERLSEQPDGIAGR